MVKKYYSFLLKHKVIVLALLVCLAFFVSFTTLSIVRHSHFGSFGYDLGINSQTVWRYSNFELPLTTSDPFPDKTKLSAHVELVYAVISPSYWIWDGPETLLILEILFLVSGGFALFLLAKRKKLSILLCFALLFGYLAFYGVQNAVWHDAHSASFAAAFLAWFIYFLDSKKTRLAIVFLLLSITAKENIGLLTFLISFFYFLKRRDGTAIIFMGVSVFYLLFIYFIYFGQITGNQYLYQNSSGLLSNLNPLSFFDSGSKREAIMYSLGSFGFLPLLAPLALLAVLGDLATYFVIASDLEASHSIFMHYRVTLAPLLVWAVIIAASKFKFLNNKYIAVYIVVCVVVVQYVLHLPLSYLAKQWFWTKPTGVEDIKAVIQELGPDDSVVAQNNILPHISSRDKIYTLYPEKKDFESNSPCGERVCNWFRWFDSPKYLMVDTSSQWDSRHLLISREEYIKGLSNLEKAGIIEKFKQKDSAFLYKVIKNP